MGRESQSRTINWTESRHNSAKDDEHRRQAEEMLERIEAVLGDYPDIMAELW